MAISSLSLSSNTYPFTTVDSEKLFRVLIQGMKTSESTEVLQCTEDTIDEVILESELDGVRYCLVRCCPKPTSQVSLSPRELMIARLIAQGLANKCIGTILNISPWTVATHLRRIFGKLGVSSRAAMVARLMEANLLQPN